MVQLSFRVKIVKIASFCCAGWCMMCVMGELYGKQVRETAPHDNEGSLQIRVYLHSIWLPFPRLRFLDPRCHIFCIKLIQPKPVSRRYGQKRQKSIRWRIIR
ncbi:hypothetical protein BGZ63DRAFT_396049 [Mariannaea sp. PMI_226]|nr:hypothetical protein BGZ63DRAFT_396049 [Mariannaea sp. PMI_226]